MSGVHHKGRFRAPIQIIHLIAQGISKFNSLPSEVTPVTVFPLMAYHSGADLGKSGPSLPVSGEGLEASESKPTAPSRPSIVSQKRVVVPSSLMM